MNKDELKRYIKNINLELEGKPPENIEPPKGKKRQLSSYVKEYYKNNREKIIERVMRNYKRKMNDPKLKEELYIKIRAYNKKYIKTEKHKSHKNKYYALNKDHLNAIRREHARMKRERLSKEKENE